MEALPTHMCHGCTSLEEVICLCVPNWGSGACKRGGAGAGAIVREGRGL